MCRRFVEFCSTTVNYSVLQGFPVVAITEKTRGPTLTGATFLKYSVLGSRKLVSLSFTLVEKKKKKLEAHYNGGYISKVFGSWQPEAGFTKFHTRGKKKKKSRPTLTEAIRYLSKA